MLFVPPAIPFMVPEAEAQSDPPPLIIAVPPDFTAQATNSTGQSLHNNGYRSLMDIPLYSGINATLDAEWSWHSLYFLPEDVNGNSIQSFSVLDSYGCTHAYSTSGNLNEFATTLLPIGSHTMTCYATHNDGRTGTASFTVTVLAPAPPPTLTATAYLNGTSGGTGRTLTLSQSDLDAIEENYPDVSGFKIEISKNNAVVLAWWYHIPDDYGNWVSSEQMPVPADWEAGTYDLHWESCTGLMRHSYQGSPGFETPCQVTNGVQMATGEPSGTSSVTIPALPATDTLSVTLSCCGSSEYGDTSENITRQAINSTGYNVSFMVLTNYGNAIINDPTWAVCSSASKSLFPVGTTTVTCTASHSAVDDVTMTFTVTVLAPADTTPPVVTVPANQNFSVDGTSQSFVFDINGPTTFVYPSNSTGYYYSLAQITATDDAGGLEPTCMAVAPDGTTWSVAWWPNYAHFNSHFGTTTITCTATDAAGNVGTASFTVTVILEGAADTTPPVLSFLNVDTDPTDGWLAEMKIIPDNGPNAWSNPGGITVEDGEGELTTGGTTTWAIRVHDEELTPTCNGNAPDLHVTDHGVLGYWSGNPSSFWVFSQNFPTGATTVTCTATNTSGNVGTTSLTVTITSEAAAAAAAADAAAAAAAAAADAAAAAASLVASDAAWVEANPGMVKNTEGSSSPGCTPNCFIPSTIAISTGDSVTWVNLDTAAHTTTSGTPGYGSSDVWNSNLMMAGGTSFAYTFDTAGTYPYFCLVHPWMVGTVIVTGATVEEEIVIPSWIKNNAGWWDAGLIDDRNYVTGLQWLISNGVMTIPSTVQGTGSDDVVPSWVKNNAGWWADGSIDDRNYVTGLQWLISNGIMIIG